MKFLAVLVAVAFAAASAQVPDCDLAKLLTISTTPAAAACKSETGFAPTPGTLPDQAKLALICKNTNCQATLAALAAANPTECLFSGVPIRSGILEKYAAACKAILTPTTTMPATAVPATNPVTTAPTTTPAPTTTKPTPTTPASTAATIANTTAPSGTNPSTIQSANTPTVIPSGRCQV